MILQGIAGFTTGFDAADLQAANALLAQPDKESLLPKDMVEVNRLIDTKIIPVSRVCDRWPATRASPASWF